MTTLTPTQPLPKYKTLDIFSFFIAVTNFSLIEFPIVGIKKMIFTILE